ncbi:phosphatase PAP2 family protein [Ralstonia solanacearum]|uniref:phosphatase PAP2 family protein n=1 Tax=Ralstonia solanacearum TaxID=305 RepID=UPI0001D9833D|nr:phosphatase PAP2 family protein [Ralstonia solanacearum]CBJ52072.1 conserved membrane protein of unknown function [Ralstonia solanacearum PSI07]
MKHAATVHDEAHAPGPALWTNGDTTRWIIAWLIVVLDAVWLAVTGRSIALEDVQQCLAVIAQLGCVTAGLALMLHGPIARRDPKYRKLAKRLRAGELAILIQALAWLIVFSGSVSVLSYLVVSLAPPLVDNQLAAMDTALGLDWMSWYQWVKAHPQIDEVLRCAYMSGQGQLLLIVVLIGLAGPIRLLRELLSNLLIALLLLFLIAAPFPAAGAFHHYAGTGAVSQADLASFSHLFPLRDGSLKVFSLNAMQGLVSMPSFHTATALFYIQATRWSRLALAISVPLNVIMISSTPTVGGHYFVDVLGGFVLWAFTVFVLRWITRATWRGADSRPLPSSTASQPG